MSGSIAVLPHATAGIAVTVALVLAPTVFPGGGDVAEARTMLQCADRHLACSIRCYERAAAKYGQGTKKTTEAAQSCDTRTCANQYKTCVANASDAKKPTKAVAEPSGTGPKTKVQPKWQPGKVSVPDKAVPVTRVPAKVQPMGGVQSWPGSGGPTFRRSR
jgi:hypothetical protein